MGSYRNQDGQTRSNHDSDTCIKSLVCSAYLWDDGELVSQVVQSYSVDVDAIDDDFAKSVLDHAEQGQGHGALSSASSAADANFLSGLYLQV